MRGGRLWKESSMERKVRVSSLDITFEMSIRYSNRVGRGCRRIYEAGVQGREPS